jgi:monoterpene epsilon-lactone hydrolase
MSIVTAIDVPVTGRLEVQHMDRPAGLSFAALKARLVNRAMQAVTTYSMKGALKAHAEGPEAFLAFVQRQREMHYKFDAPTLPMLEAEAVRQLGPGPGLASPPAPSEWFAPRHKKPRGFVFYVHGGSFVAERSPRITSLVARFAATAEARVFAPSYRLAPEHPCPAAVEDIVAAWAWFQETWPGEPVVALAESAGAAIMVAALQQGRARGLPMPSGMVLLSPWLDLSLQSWSVAAASLLGTTPHTMESLAVFARFYLNGLSPTDPVASPMFGDFHGFPPTLIHASRGDILYDDAVRVAECMRDAGGDLTVRLWAEETHVWERMQTATAKQSILLAAEFIRRRLDGGAIS